ncbi:Meiosis-specific serine/threonine-protein kinase mek1 [Linnemannia exigua]|uniref:Meiosis-specific serine/threonine-protein kinase mek1 n=1 Tax=Linnemannia exigua TaxID=604196 RepID=A0AAD4H8H2_9FUNG|nr:Meiosis-specific serine/threonine-protein kinase mek1 [Linnemannia exigua]
MPSSQVQPPSLDPSQQATQAIPFYPALEGTSLMALEEASTKEMESVAGWLVNALTLEICLVIRKGKSVTIGRYQTCDLVVTDDVVSNRHCEISTNSAGFVLCKDMSINGTYWNRGLIGRGESVILSHGDTIRFRHDNHYIFQDFVKDIFDHVDPDIGIVEKTYHILPRTLGKYANKRWFEYGGTFARVILAVHRKSNMQLAVKIMDRLRYAKPEYSGGTNIENEVVLLRTLCHANIVPVVDVIKTTRYIYIFMQIMVGGDLFDQLVRNGPIPELEAKYIAYQALNALQPENLLLTTNAEYPRVLLSDFGMASECGPKEVMSTMCGTFAYMAPEVFDVKHANGPGYDFAADCWSMGIVLYVILSGTHPFTPNYATEDEKVMRVKMRREVQFPPKYWEGVSVEARTLIRFLLTIDPKKRWTVDDALESQWIQEDLAWLRTKYRENVLRLWLKSCQVLDSLTAATRPRQQQQQHIQQQPQNLHQSHEREKRQPASAKRMREQDEEPERNSSRTKRVMKRVESFESDESLPASHQEPSTNNSNIHWANVAVPDISNNDITGSW